MKTKKKQILDLWKIVFEDSAKFTRMYFDRVYRDENAMVIEDNGRVLSSLQMIPYTMMFCGEEISVAYISGACTLPSEQGKGLMYRLLQETFEKMKYRRVALTALIPAEKWLFNYYRKQGYTEIFEFSLKVYTRNECIEPERDIFVLPQEEEDDKLSYVYFDRKLRERPACILHTYDDYVTIMKDLKISKGKCFVACNCEKQPVGMAFVYPQEKTTVPESILIKELLYDDERIKKQLLFKVTEYYKVYKGLYRIPFKDSLITSPYGMGRVIDKERLITLWKTTHPIANITVDKLYNMNIDALTGLLFNYSDKMAYMSLMLD